MNAQFPTLHQRTRGTAEVVMASGRLQRLYTQGSAKAILLHAARPEVVFLNTAGGLTGGDRLGFSLQADSDTTATTQTAERAYRSEGDTARLDVALTIARGRLDWLPQETILFDRSALRRRTQIALGPEAECLLLEAVVLGRAAMGETVRDLSFHDIREVTRAGRPVLVEPVRLSSAALSGPATLQGARAFASMALIARGAADALTPVRAALDEAGVRGAASGFDGKLTIRLMAADGWPLRRQIARLVAVLRKGPLPRVWQI
ncbi:MAG: urease accessory protein UreD [Rhodobacteraceae bacterium]|nr:urease accessory protein UreD [Paracoccaceae bacterium]